MKNMLMFLVVAVASMAFAAEPILVEFSADRKDCLYKVGEKASLFVTGLTTNGQKVTSGSVRFVMDDCGTNMLYVGKVDFSKVNPAKYEVTLDKPGFVRCMVRNCYAKDYDGSVKEFSRRMYSLGFDVEKIKKVVPDNPDFDKFWSQAKAKLERDVPIDVQMREVPERSTEYFTYYRISFATYKQRIHAYMSVPKKAKKPYPLEISVSSAGFGDHSNDMNGRRDRISVFFTMFPFEPDWKWRETGLEDKYNEFEKQLMQKYRVPGYSNAGIIEKSPEDYYYYPHMLGIDRAINYLVSRDDVDRTKVWYQGTSQGGGFGFYLCGLNHSFTRSLIFVPGLCDLMGCLEGRRSGWPYFLEVYKKRPDEFAAALKNIPYYDAANFASRIKCPVRVIISFGDLVVSPTSAYSAYNEIKVKDKAAVIMPHCTHDVDPKVRQELRRWMSR